MDQGEMLAHAHTRIHDDSRSASVLVNNPTQLNSSSGGRSSGGAVRLSPMTEAGAAAPGFPGLPP